MKHIICGTNRPNSRSMAICKILQKMYKEEGVETKIIDLERLELQKLTGAEYGGDGQPQILKDCNKELLESEAFILVVPEYNGSMPGVLKYFIDHWKFPDTFEYRPVCFVGLGGRYGGLRPVEHLQGVFGYRNSFIFPERVFISNVWSVLEGEVIKDETINDLLKSQVTGFTKFIKALQDQKLDNLHRVKEQ